MNGEYPVDFDEPIGRVRKYIPDLTPLPDTSDPDGPKNFIFSDDELQSFLDDEVVDKRNVRSWEVKRAAAYAMIALGNNENLILKKIVTQDQQTDGPSVARAYVTAAAALIARADADQENSAAVQETFIDVFPTQTRAPQHYYRRAWLR